MATAPRRNKSVPRMSFLSSSRYGSSASRVSNDEDDDDDDEQVSLSDLNFDSRRSHSRSIMHDYCFSDDEVETSYHGRDSSLHQHDLYVDSDGENGKKKKSKQQDTQRSRNLDALISPAPRRKKLNVKAPKARSPQQDNSLSLDALISPTPGKKKKAKKMQPQNSVSSGLDARALEENLLSLDALLSPEPARKKKSKKLQVDDTLALDALLSPTQTRKKKAKRTTRVKKKKSFDSSDDSRGSFYQVDADQYETDTDDGEDFELENVKDLIEKRRQAKQALVEKALTLNRSSMKKSLSKKSLSKKKDGLSLSNHSQNKSPIRQRRTVDALSLSSHTKERAERAIRRNRRGSTKKDFLEGSSSNLDFKPKRSASLRSIRDMDESNHSTKSASKRSKKKAQDMDDDRSHKSAPRPSKKKNLEMDDERSNKSAPTRRKKKAMDGSNHSPKRSSSIRKIKKERFDDSDNDSIEVDSKKGNSSKSRQRRLVKKKSSEIMDDQSTSSDSTLSSVSETEMQLGALERAIASPRSPRRARVPAGSGKALRTQSLRLRGDRRLSSSKSPFRSGSLRMSAATDGLNSLSKKLNNMALSASDHGLRPKRTPRGNRGSGKDGEDEMGGGKAKTSRMSRRNSEGGGMF